MRTEAKAQLWARPTPVDAWCAGLLPGIERWSPPAGLDGDLGRVVDRLVGAAHEGERWLFHPCLATLTLPHADRPANALQLVLWAGAHSEEPLGTLRLSRELWAWGAGGGRMVEAGAHDVVELGRAVHSDGPLGRWAIDVWADTLGHPYPSRFPYSEEWSWHGRLPLDPPAREELGEQTRTMLASLAAFEHHLPECAAWVAAATSVIVPIVRARSQEFKSGSVSGFPGAVFIESRTNEALFLEALVHESAHLHFYLAEASEPLVDPGHDGAYVSPLRPDPRPLRGIFLAFHALAHMCAFYATPVVMQSSPACATELEGLGRRRDDAAATLEGAREHLTEAGRALFDRTRELGGTAA
jgi:HEXXH motif-containing protein